MVSIPRKPSTGDQTPDDNNNGGAGDDNNRRYTHLKSFAEQHRARLHKSIGVLQELIPDGTDLGEVDDRQLRGLLQDRILRLEQLMEQVLDTVEKSIPVYEKFLFTEPTVTFELRYPVNNANPIWVTYETLPQKKHYDFTIAGNIFTWLNPEDTHLIGDLEIIYYRASA